MTSTVPPGRSSSASLLGSVQTMQFLVVCNKVLRGQDDRLEAYATCRATPQIAYSRLSVSQGSYVPTCQMCPSGSRQENALPPYSFSSRSITILAPASLALA
jgi:hypothetical protein